MKLSHSTSIAFMNQKGGCGKTSSCVSVAAALSSLGYMCTVVDTDQQCNATDNLGLERDKHSEAGGFTLADAYLTRKPLRDIEVLVPLASDPNPDSDNQTPTENVLPRPWLVPGNRGLGTIEKRLEAELHTMLAEGNQSPLDADDIRSEHRNRLKSGIASLRGKRDFILIDTPPDLGFLMTTALIAADYYVIPVFPSGYDLSGLESLTLTVEKVRKRYNPKLQLLGVLLGNYNPNAKLDRDIFQMLQDKFGKEFVFSTPINSSVRHREATVYRKTILEHSPRTPASEQYIQIAREIVSRTESASTARPKLEVTINRDVVQGDEPATTEAGQEVVNG